MRHDEVLPGSALARAMNRFDDGDVDEAFLPRWLRGSPRLHRLREMDELRRELVALRESLALTLVADAHLVRQTFGIFVRGIDGDAALGAHHLIARAIRGAEAADEI